MDNDRGNNELNSQPASSVNTFSVYMARIYGWMFLGLIITAAMAVYTANSSLRFLALNPVSYLLLAVIELGLVWYLSSRAMDMKYENAQAAFIVYSGINGITLSLIFFRYQLGSISLVFFITAALFGFMSIYGIVTKEDFTKWGTRLFVGLIGIIIATVVNLFLQNDTFSLIISYIGVALFLGLTVYDSARMKEMYLAYSGTEKEKNISIVGALILYLDFINLFLFILRILGRRR